MTRDQIRRALVGLAEMYERPPTVRQLARALARPKSTVHHWLARHNVPRRRRRLAAQVEQRLRAKLAEPRLMSTRKIAAAVGCSKSTVARRLDVARGRSKIKTCRKWRCPGCGRLLVINRCLACALNRGRG